MNESIGLTSHGKLDSPFPFAVRLVLPITFGLVIVSGHSNTLSAFPWILGSAFIVHWWAFGVALGSPSRPTVLACLGVLAGLLQIVLIVLPFHALATLVWSLGVAFCATARFPATLAVSLSLLLVLLNLVSLSQFFYTDPPAEAYEVTAANLLGVGLLWYTFHLHRGRDEARARVAAGDRATMLLTRSNVLLQAQAAHAAILATHKERERLARDVHDSVGHTLTSVNLQLRALQETWGLPQENSTGRLNDLMLTTSEGLAQIRGALREWTDEGPSMLKGPELWLGVIGAFSQSCNTRIVPIIEGDFDGLSDEVLEVIFRFIQEGLTNAVRHGEAHDVEVSVRNRDGVLCLRVVDNGRGSEKTIPGQGLKGMRSRIEQLGGRLEWRTKKGQGFDIGADLALPTGDLS